MNSRNIIWNYVLSLHQSADYKQYLQRAFPETAEFVSELQGDNQLFFKNDVLTYSLRLTDKGQDFQHIDFYRDDVTRPFKRTVIDEDSEAFLERYYLLDTWQRLYDVYLDGNFEPVFTEVFIEDEPYFVNFKNQGQICSADELAMWIKNQS